MSINSIICSTNIDHGKNKIVKSALTSYSSKLVEEAYSLKYVSSGKELYKLDNTEYQLNSSFLLIANPDQTVELEVESKEPVNGICCFIDKDLMNEVANFKQVTRDNLLDSMGEKVEFNYLINIPVHAQGTQLYDVVSKIQNIDKKKLNSFDEKDFFISLAEKISSYSSSIYKNVSKFECSKISTKKELFRRIQIGRSYINDNLSNSGLKLNEIANESYLSEYHFHRNFRNFFDVTPYQYISENRLKLAKMYLSSGKYQLEEIYTLCGYNDLNYFKNCFRKWCLANKLT